jgi:phage host-nuclease inhibitor protein Gam
MSKIAAASAPPESPITEQQALDNMKVLATLNGQLDNVNSHAKLDAIALSNKYADKIKELESQIAVAEATVKQYVNDNRDKVMNGKKSTKFGLGTIGFRTGKPKVSLLPEMDWSAVIQKAKKLLPTYVREEWALQKDKILSDFANRPDAKEALEPIGLEIIQDETFFIKL